MLLLLQLLLELQYHILLFEPRLLRLPGPRQLQIPLLLKLLREVLNLVLLDKYFLLQVRQLVLVELELLEVLDLQLQFVQLTLYCLLLAEGGVSQHGGLPQGGRLGLQFLDFGLLEADGLLVGLVVLGYAAHCVLELHLAVVQLGVGFL